MTDDERAEANAFYDEFKLEQLCAAVAALADNYQADWRVTLTFDDDRPPLGVVALHGETTKMVLDRVKEKHGGHHG